MARTRKTSDRGTTESDKDDVTPIEDAVVIEETVPVAETPRDIEDAPRAVEETAPEAAPEITLSEPDTTRTDEPPVEALAEERAPEPESRAEPEPEPEPEPVRPAAAAPPPPRSEPAPRRSGGSGALGLLAGGVIAALAGVGASRYVFPDGWPGARTADAALTELQQAADAQTARIAELETALSSLRDQVSAVPDPSAAIESLRSDLGTQISDAATAASDAATRLGQIDQQVAALSQQLEALAQRPMPEGLDPASLDAELADFRQQLSTAVSDARSQIVAAQQEAAAIAAKAADDAAAAQAAAAQEAEATRAAAEAAAATAEREAAIARIRAAVENGEPYADDLAALGGTDIPAALSGPAADGVPTLASLVAAFPDAARAALEASIRATMGDSTMDRFTAFLRVQTGARSLEPREGDDPDAILSRAEASLQAGDIAAALTELGALPEAGQAALAGWVQSAQTRLAALQAAQSLTPN